MKNMDLNGEWKNLREWKNPAGWTLTWIFDSFFTKSKKSSNHFLKNHQILNKDQRFKSKGMKKPARGKKKSRWMENSIDKSRWMKKIPLDEKPRVNLVMCERNCLRLKNPCFIQECVIPPFKRREEWYCLPPKGTNDGLRRVSWRNEFFQIFLERFGD